MGYISRLPQSLPWPRRKSSSARMSEAAEASSTSSLPSVGVPHEMSSFVWDSSAVLLILNQEPGWEKLIDDLPGGSWSVVNYCEVTSKLADSGLPKAGVEKVMGALPHSLEPFTADDALTAGLLRPITRHLGLSLGDRACLALGIRLDKLVLTADRAWQALDVGPRVRLAR